MIKTKKLIIIGIIALSSSAILNTLTDSIVLAGSIGKKDYAGCLQALTNRYGKKASLNSALTSICNDCYNMSNSPTPCGAAWINGSGNGVADISSVAQYTGSSEPSKVSVYIQGMFLAGGAGNAGQKNWYAINLKLCENTNNGSCNKNKKPSYITNTPSTSYYRGSFNKNNATHEFTEGWENGKLRLDVNFQKFKQGITPNVSYINGSKCSTYEREIYITREPSVDGTQNGLMGSPKTDKSTIRIQVCLPAVTTFTGTTEAWVNYTNSRTSEQTKISNNGSRRIYDNSASIWFWHTIKRNNDGPDSALKTQWYVNGYWEKNKSWYDTKDLAKNGTDSVHMKNAESINITPGQSLTLWQTIHYYSKSSNGSLSDEDTPNIRCSLMGNEEGRFCIKIYRKPAKFSGSTSAQVVTNNQTYINPSNTITTANDGKYTIKFEHKIKREDKTTERDYGAGGTVAPWFYTRAWGSSTKGALNSGYGTAVSAKQTGAMAEDAETFAVSYEDSEFSGTLYPGETKTFCQNMVYNNVVDASIQNGGTNASTGDRCVRVYRPKTSCTINNTSYDFGVENSGNRNYASLMVKNSTTGKSAKTSEDSGNVSIWAKPGDMIGYEYDICAAGQMSDDYFNGDNATSSKYEFSGNNTTAQESNKGKYLFGNTLGNGNGAGHVISIGKVIGSSSETTFPAYTGTYYSPDVASIYSCNKEISRYYKVLGGSDSDSCGTAAAKVGRNRDPVATKNSDVGSTISQTVKYDKKTSINDRSTTSIKGEVKVPYNYLTEVVDDKAKSNTPVSPGRSIKYETTIKTVSRCNRQTAGDCSETTAYKTVPKTTKYRIISYYLDPNTTTSNVDNKVMSKLGQYNTSTVNRNNKVYGYRSLSDPANNSAVTLIKSGDDLFKGKEEAKISDATNARVQDYISVGTKICFSVALYPYDSHNQWYSSEINSENQSAALSNTGDKYWFIARPTCYTVGKKPTFAVREGGIYTIGGIEATSFSINSNTYSSWSEYTIASKGPVKGTASGAATWGGNSAGGNRNCVFSSMTLSNASCNTSDDALGKLSQISQRGVASSPTQIVEQIKRRYTQSNVSTVIPSNTPFTPYGTCATTDNGVSYQPTSDSSRYLNCLPNATMYYDGGDGTLIVGTGDNRDSWFRSLNEYSSNTMVAHAKNIFIQNNMRIGNIDDLENTRYTAITRKPQRMFIAEDTITISSRVTRIDGWLIAKKIITCDVSPNNIDFTKCNKPLEVHGPVFTKHLMLYRTYGGGQNNFTSGNQTSENTQRNFAAPAETFTIGAETYLWAYSQSARYSQAATTYQRELAPRF